jgi:hypothetical protein
LLLSAAVVLLAVAPAPSARADADPPSDYLYGTFNDLYLPLGVPTPGRDRARLLRLLARARGSGHPYKVAVIYDRSDLGAVPVYIDKPAAYVKFLYGEIGFNLEPQHATLLVVLPTGMAVAGADAAAGGAALARLRVPPRPSTAALAQTAAKAMAAVAAASGHPLEASGHTGGGLRWWFWALMFVAALLAARFGVTRLSRRQR